MNFYFKDGPQITSMYTFFININLDLRNKNANLYFKFSHIQSCIADKFLGLRRDTFNQITTITDKTIYKTKHIKPTQDPATTLKINRHAEDCLITTTGESNYSFKHTTWFMRFSPYTSLHKYTMIRRVAM